MAQTQSSVKDVIPDIGGNFTLDESVIAGKYYKSSAHREPD